MEILDIKDLTFSYAGSEKNALENVSFAVNEGEFVCVCGPTGGGKSTLLRLLKKELAPKGETGGSVRELGKDISDVSERESAALIAFVAQRPEEQTVTDRVCTELWFSSENLGVKENDAMPRVAEISALFGLDALYDTPTNELSGGQKQLLCLASVLVTRPRLLLLDEPTSRLDPVSRETFVSMLSAINEKLGVTVVISEHNTAGLLKYADKMLVLEDGKMTAFGKPEDVLSARPSPAVLSDMPPSVRLHYRLGREGDNIPLSVKEGREAFSSVEAVDYAGKDLSGADTALEFDNVYFRYGRDSKDVLSGVSLSMKKGGVYFLLGSNGSGKSTLLSCAAGLLRPYSGSVKLFSKKLKNYQNDELYKKIALLTQDVYNVFLHDTVREEFKGYDITSLPFDVSAFADRHPYDLSGGEAQLTALCRILCKSPEIILLDEPTKGLDAEYKKKFSDIIGKLAGGGMTVLIVSHDTELAAELADECFMIFGGRIVSAKKTADFIRSNSLYTTDFCRMTDGKIII